MGFRRLLVINTCAITPPAIYLYSTIRRLDPSTSSSIKLRTPSSGPGSYHTPHVDVYGTKVPAKLLVPQQSTLADNRTLSPEEACLGTLLSPIAYAQA